LASERLNNICDKDMIRLRDVSIPMLNSLEKCMLIYVLDFLDEGGAEAPKAHP
jgi:hypothetical protein